VSTPAYAELVTAVRREGEGILTAAGMGLDAPVATCAGWDVAAVVRHVSKVYSRIGYFVLNRVSERPESLPDLPAGEPVDVLRELLDELITVFTETDAEAPVWTWVFEAQGNALFWARRMAHESSIHRFDAQSAHGLEQPIDAELASDGIDEFIDIVLPRVYERMDVSGPTGMIGLHSTDGGAWTLALESNRARRVDAVSDPDVSISGPSSTLLLAAWGRVPWSSLQVAGDIEVVERWSAAINP
jgi:uncharacterized protein (TIGR03083 family)